MFQYRGPATIDGVAFPDVRLDEEREGGLRSWRGGASVAANNTPDGFSPDFGGDEAATITLPDGRSGQALVTSVGFDGRMWTIEMTGTGPAPR